MATHDTDEHGRTRTGTYGGRLLGFFRWLLCFLAVVPGFETAAQESPQEALADMNAAPGVEVTLFAAEDDLLNPTSMDVDAQGRVWIAEAVNYRLFNQPVTSPDGDRIRVLEDTNGDGQCDKATTFYQHPSLQAPMGIAVLGNRVYVCQAPDLFYLEDVDGDLKADNRVVVLTGFRGVDNDHSIHGVMFGPDGHLYFSNGDQGLDVTDKSGNRVHVGKDAPHMAGSVLRCDLEGNRLELLAEGMRNPYEPTVDCFGNVFISDNDDDGNEQVRINYVMEGGNYGYWPRRKGNRRFDAVHWNEDQPGVVPKMIRTGFGSPCGIMFYEGDLLPEPYRMTLLHADAGPAVIRSFPVLPDGAGFRSRIDTMLSCPDDSWFRPVDVCAAPDGSILVADWYDPGVGGHRMKDVTQGRVYRLAPAGAGYVMPALDLESPPGIAAALVSPNQARRFLGHERAVQQVENGNSDAIEDLWKSGNIQQRARALWVLSADPAIGTTTLQGALADADARIRTTGVRILGRRSVTAMRMADRLHNDPDSAVRRQLVLELGEYRQTDWVKPALLNLALSFDGGDRFYREAVGLAFKGEEEWAFQSILDANRGVWNQVVAQYAVQFHPRAAQPLALAAANNEALDAGLRSLALDALDAIGSADAGATMVSMLRTDVPKDLQERALYLLQRDEGDRWRHVLLDSSVDTYLEHVVNDSALAAMAWQFVAETRRPSFLPVVAKRAADANASAVERAQSLALAQRLAVHASPEQMGAAMDILEGIIHDENPEIATAALGSLYALRTPRSNELVRDVLTTASLPKNVRREAVRLLASNKSGCVQMLNLAEKGELPVELQLDVTEAVHASPDEDVRMMAAQILPRERSVGGHALPPLADLLTMQGDAESGRKVFFDQEKAQCYRCHKVNGEGKDVGPDLSKIGEKYGKDGLIESILNPSAAISPQYQVWIIETIDFVSYSGFIKSETPESLVIMDSAGNAVDVKKSDIEERRMSSTSLMPTGLTVAMNAQELVDLVAYLATLK